MRTDTNTFRKNVISDLRAAGLSCAKARRCAMYIDYAADVACYPEIGDTSKAEVSVDCAEEQTVYINDNGIARFHCAVPADMQPLLNTAANQEQQALSEQLADLIPEIYSAMQRAEDAGITESRNAPEVVALNAQYDAIRDQILAINPEVHGGVVDPESYSFYSDMHKSTYGFRPRGFINYPTMKEDMERMLRDNKEEMAEAA